METDTLHRQSHRDTQKDMETGRDIHGDTLRQTQRYTYAKKRYTETHGDTQRQKKRLGHTEAQAKILILFRLTKLVIIADKSFTIAFRQSISATIT